MSKSMSKFCCKAKFVSENQLNNYCIFTDLDLMTQPSRKLAALIFTDIVGYSRLAKENEQLAMEVVKEHRTVIRNNLGSYGGVERQTIGDGFFIEFASAVDAVRCAINIQIDFNDRQRHLPTDRRVQIRVGIHMGDIVSSGPDLYGNNVNIAARIEPLARPGGICISRQIYEHVSEVLTDVKFIKLGRRDLKNIEGGTSIYRIQMPWEKNSDSWLSRIRPLRVNSFVPTKLKSQNGLLLGLISMTLAAVLFTIAYHLVGSLYSMTHSENSSHAKYQLPTDWQFINTACKGSLEDCLRGVGPKQWAPYDYKKSWKYGDLIEGRYWLRLQFDTPVSLAEDPAVILGIVSESHRVYLNGHFIGGSDAHYNLAAFSFSPDILRSEGKNTILIDAHTKKKLDPGLSPIRGIGSYIGSFAAAEADIQSNRLKFQILKSIYFALSLIILLACIALAVFSIGEGSIVYSALYLSLGCINIAYYLPWLGATVDYQVMRYLKTISLAMVPLVLISGRLCSLGRQRAELYNNVLAFAFLGAITLCFIPFTVSQAHLVKSYNVIMLLAAGYALMHILRGVTDRTRLKHKGSYAWVNFDNLFFLFLIVSIGPILGSLKGPLARSLMIPGFRSMMIDFSMMSPFFFSLAVIVTILKDTISKNLMVSKTSEFDQLRLKLLHLLHTESNIQSLIESIQREVSSAIGARRSTLYVFENGSTLKAEHVVAEESVRFRVSDSISSRAGVIGYCLENKSPLLLTDIRNDLRFSGPNARYPITQNDGYESGSCMIFPLISGGETIGALTLADKCDGQFTKEDFAKSLEISSTIALLIENSQFRRSRKEPKEQLAVVA